MKNDNEVRAIKEKIKRTGFLVLTTLFLLATVKIMVSSELTFYELLSMLLVFSCSIITLILVLFKKVTPEKGFSIFQIGPVTYGVIAIYDSIFQGINLGDNIESLYHTPKIIFLLLGVGGLIFSLLQLKKQSTM